MTTMKVAPKFASKVTLGTLIALVFITLTGHVATAASAPILVRRMTETYGTGKVRITECAISVDGVVMTRDFDGITSTEERTFKLTGAIDAKMDDVAATKAEPNKVSTADFSYTMNAFRTTSSGATEKLVLSYYDGVKGEELYNLSAGAATLRNILIGVCTK